jgi:hypothetical protein
MIDYKNLRAGTMLVKEFYLVALVPPDGRGFFIVGGSSDPDRWSPGGSDTIKPCIGTNAKQAFHDFRRAVDQADGSVDGKLVIIRLVDGTVEHIKELAAPGQTSITA